MGESDELFSLYSTISRVSHHCFKLCDGSQPTPSLSSSCKECIKTCVHSAFTNRSYIIERFNKEYPASKHHNKSLEFTSVVDFT